MKSESIFIIQPETSEQEDALKAFVKALKIKFEITSENPYDPDFVKKIEKGRKELEEGKGKKFTVEELNSLWK